MKARYFAIYKKSKKYDRAFHSPHKKKTSNNKKAKHKQQQQQK